MIQDLPGENTNGLNTSRGCQYAPEIAILSEAVGQKHPILTGFIRYSVIPSRKVDRGEEQVSARGRLAKFLNFKQKENKYTSY